MASETEAKASKAAKSISKNKGVKIALIAAVAAFVIAFAIAALNIWLGLVRITP